MTRTVAKIVLLVEDNPGDVRLLREMLNEQSAYNTELIAVGSIAEARAHLAAHAADVILLDLGLPDAHGIDAVRKAHAAAPRTPLIVLTGLDDEVMATEALKQGAQDFLIKGQVEARSLLRSVRYAIERKNMEERLFAEVERAQVTLNCIAEAVACTDEMGCITFLNRMAEQMTGWTMAEAVGRPMELVLRIVDATTRVPVINPMVLALNNDEPGTLQPNCVLIARDGSETPIEDSVAPIHDREGEATGAVIVFRDVREARELAHQTIHAARHDYLTGLPNRMLLNDRIGQAIALAPRHKKKVALLFLDLDGFKHINDSLGHQVGDRLLQSVGSRLVDCVRASDTVSRQGGDEFVVLLSEVERAEDAAISATRMLEAIARPHTIDGHELHVTASIGVSIHPDDASGAEALIRNADLAMYKVKEAGRQTYRFFEPAMNMRAIERQSIEEALRQAIEREEFTLVYQPKINLSTGAVAGAEALIRWNHPSRGLLAPADFVPVAEASGLIQPIGNWVLREACRQAHAWIDAGLSLPRIAVNVSPLEFRGEDFLNGVFAVLEDTGLDPEALELELTEGALMEHAEVANAILGKLRGKGVHFAVDDFGTGYSSLDYLRKFPIETLKIDQSFIRQIGSSGDDRSVITAVLSMARSLKLRVVAEGVETPHELAFLQSNQCDEAQGFYFSRPLPAHKFARMLQTGIVPAMAESRLTSSAPSHREAARAP